MVLAQRLEQVEMAAPSIHTDFLKIRVSSIGDKALLIDVLGDLTIKAQRKIWAMARACQQWEEVAETIPGMANLLLVLTQIPAPSHALIERIHAVWDLTQELDIKGKTVEIPVTYGGDKATDLAALCDYSGLKDHEIIRLHYSTMYRVFALGSVPGFGYLYGLDARLYMPRKQIPVLNMPKGCVIIGGMQTGIAMLTGPNGWHSIGHAEISMFEPQATPPTLLGQGDNVRFVPEKIEL